MRKLKNDFWKRFGYISMVFLGLMAVMAFMVAPEATTAIAGSLAMVPVWGVIKDGTFKVLSPEEVSKLELDDQVKYFNDLNIHKENQLKDLKAQMKKDATDEIKAQIETLKADIVSSNKEELKVMHTALKEQGLAITKLLKSNGGNVTNQVKTMIDQINDAKDGITKAVDKQVKEYEFAIKANTTRASVTNSTQAMRLLDIGQLSHRKLTAKDVFSVVPVAPGSNGVIRYADWDAASTVRAAAMVAEGGTYPESEAVWEEFTLQLKKIGDTIPVTEEMVQDAPRFAAELDMFINVNISIVEDTQLMTGDGTGNNLNGIYPTVPAYTAVASGISDASRYDLLVVMRSNITGTHGAKYAPDFAFMNTVDITAMKLKKDANENYIIPPFVDRNGEVVDGMVVVENNAITADTLVIGDSRYAKVYEVEGYTMAVGYSGTQFTEDLMTLKGRKRENLLIRNIDQTGFLKCEGIAAALVTLAT